MPLTVGQVAALPDLGLSVRTVEADLDRVVRWVAVSEHADPTPWLDGGDLLLTTGMSITGDESQAAEYVYRLVAADVAALGFGVGLSHQSVPAALVAAAEAAGLPLLEVPQPIPFVALSKAVSRLLTDEEYAESAASFDSQRRLIRAALAEPAAAGVIPVLARHVGGFALHLDQAGGVVGAYPTTSAGRAADLAGEVDRLRSRGLLASAAVATSDEHVAILPIGVKGAADGFLVVGSPRPLRSADQAVMNLAVSVLSWHASQPVATEAGMDAWRRLLLSTAAEHGVSQDLLAGLGLPHLGPAAGGRGGGAGRARRRRRRRRPRPPPTAAGSRSCAAPARGTRSGSPRRTRTAGPAPPCVSWPMHRACRLSGCRAPSTSRTPPTSGRPWSRRSRRRRPDRD